MKVDVISKDELKVAYDKACKQDTLENMVNFGTVVLDGGCRIDMFFNKKDGKLMCLCEDEECQFKEQHVNSFEDVCEYIKTNIREWMDDKLSSFLVEYGVLN